MKSNYFSEPATKCLQMRSKFLNQLSGVSSSLLPGVQFVPNCDEKGNFERIQCWTMLGLCWCVGPHDGKELPGSRVNVTQGGEPDCFKSEYSFSAFCPYNLLQVCLQSVLKLEYVE